MAAAWCIWRQRNNKIFEGRVIKKISLKELYSYLHCGHQSKEFSKLGVSFIIQNWAQIYMVNEILGVTACER